VIERAKTWLIGRGILKRTLGITCSKCGSENTYVMQPTGKGRCTRPARKGLMRCRSCRKQFSKTSGTVFRRIKTKPGIYEMYRELREQGFSAHKVGKMMGLLQKTAWLMNARMEAEPHQKKMQEFSDWLKGMVGDDRGVYDAGMILFCLAVVNRSPIAVAAILGAKRKLCVKIKEAAIASRIFINGENNVEWFNKDRGGVALIMDIQVCLGTVERVNGGDLEYRVVKS